MGVDAVKLGLLRAAVGAGVAHHDPEEVVAVAEDIR